MKTGIRILGALAAFMTGAIALAHPGHEAPPVHAHDLDEALAMIATTLVAAVIGAGVLAVRRRKRKSRS